MHPLLLITATTAAAKKPAVMDLGDKLIPEDGIAGELVHYMAHCADKILEFFGVSHNPSLAVVFYSIIVLVFAIVVGYVCRWITLKIVNLICSRFNSLLIKVILQRKFFSTLTSFIPALTYLILLHLSYMEGAGLTRVLTKLTLIYIIYLSVLTLNKFITVLWVYFDHKQNKRKLPLKSIAQLLQCFTGLIGIIVAIGLLVNKSPAALLAGLGAFAAVLMLVFKDSFLSVVASVQLSEEDALHVGDWIKVPHTEANGTVIEANLFSVKVLNWDHTTTMLPPYSLVSGSFTNYRSMQEENARRINRTYAIDADSIRFLDKTSRSKYKSIPFLNDWITMKEKQEADGEEAEVTNPAGLVNGSIETNLGLFRAYMKMYLDHSKYVDHEQLCMVGTDQQTSAGIPFFIYCFTNTSVWADYISIQSKIFEHIAAMLTFFDLVVFENPSGRDTIAEGYVGGGRADNIFGGPEPFLTTDLPNIQNGIYGPKGTKPQPTPPSASEPVPVRTK